MPKVTKTMWYLCGESSAVANEFIARALEDQYASEAFKEIECADDKKHHLYQVPNYSFASRIKKSERSLAISVQIYRSQNNGRPGLWTFVPRKKTNITNIIERSNAFKEKLGRKFLKMKAR